MSVATAGWLQLGLLVVALGACYMPVGNYMAHIFTTDKHWRVERGIYKLIGVDPATDQKWSVYLRSMLAFSVVSVLFLYGLERLQHYLLLSLGHGQRAARAGLEHRRLVRDQHQLAELLRRVHDGLPRPDVRPGGAELPVRRRRHRGRDRAGPRVHPVQDRQARQLLGRRDQDHDPVPDPAVRRRRAHPGRLRRDRQLLTPTTS